MVTPAGLRRCAEVPAESRNVRFVWSRFAASSPCRRPSRWCYHTHRPTALGSSPRPWSPVSIARSPRSRTSRSTCQRTKDDHIARMTRSTPPVPGGTHRGCRGRARPRPDRFAGPRSCHARRRSRPAPHRETCRSRAGTANSDTRRSRECSDRSASTVEVMGSRREDHPRLEVRIRPNSRRSLRGSLDGAGGQGGPLPRLVRRTRPAAPRRPAVLRSAPQ